jgi:hypothetical protein
MNYENACICIGMNNLINAIVEDWKKDGTFEALPVGHPLAQILAQKSLTQAKKIEKKLEEKGVISMLRMGYEFAKSKVARK